MNSPDVPICEVMNISHSYQGDSWFSRRPPDQKALNGVNLSVTKGEAIAIVGESGSGKSTLGAILTGMLTPQRGDARYRGSSYKDMSRRTWRSIRCKIPVVPQNPSHALNPRLRLGYQILEPLLIQKITMHRNQLRDRLDATLDAVGLSPDIAGRYPKETSGGQRQRVLIARALIAEPDLILFDEATSALDVIVQSQILRLIEQLRAQHHVAVIFITHDLSVARHVADQIIVLKNGKVVERGLTNEVLVHPTAPYTQQLLASVLPFPATGRRDPK